MASARGPDRERDPDRSEQSELSRDNFNPNPYERTSSQRRMREIRRQDDLHNAQQQQGHQSNAPLNSANHSDDSSQSFVGQLDTTNPTRGNDVPGSNPQSVNAGREIRNPNDEPDSGNSNTRDPDAGWPAHVLTWIKDVRKEIDDRLDYVYNSRVVGSERFKGSFPRHYYGIISPSTDPIGFFNHRNKTLTRDEFSLPDLVIWYPEA